MQNNTPRMPDLSPNPNYVPPEQRQPKKKVIRRKRKTTTSRSSNRQTAKTATARPKKELPRSSVSQPRDQWGRFARKAGTVIWGAAKGTAQAIAGGVKTARSAHKTIKRVNAANRRRRNLEMRERAVDIAEREQKLRKRKVLRRKKHSC
jgi:hypothetical protein